MTKQAAAAFNWVFTINNPTVQDEQALLDDVPYRYLIYQHELAESGTHHIQGYMVLQSRMRRTALSSLLPHAFLEVRKGSHEQAKAYCSKEDTRMVGTEPVEWGSEEGIAKKPGSRSDLSEIKKKIDSGASSERIWDEHFSSSIRYHKSFDAYRDIKSRHRVYEAGEKPRIFIYWGPSGTGKSTRARTHFPGAYWLTKPSQATSTVWWQNYSGEDVVVFDEFYGWITYDLILRILDFYPVTVEKKNGSAKLAAKTFVFTSNKHPDEWYSKVKDTSALKRRISEFGTIEYLGETFNKPVEQGYISEEL